METAIRDTDRWSRKKTNKKRGCPRTDAGRASGIHFKNRNWLAWSSVGRHGRTVTMSVRRKWDVVCATPCAHCEMYLSRAHLTFSGPCHKRESSGPDPPILPNHRALNLRVHRNSEPWHRVLSPTPRQVISSFFASVCRRQSLAEDSHPWVPPTPAEITRCAHRLPDGSLGVACLAGGIHPGTPYVAWWALQSRIAPCGCVTAVTSGGRSQGAKLKQKKKNRASPFRSTP